MTALNQPTYDIQQPTRCCALTGCDLLPGQPYMATLVEVDDDPDSAGLRRLDISIDAWQSPDRPQKLFSYWRTTVPEAKAKKKLFVDDDVLMNLFRRLADTDQPQRIAFRFVLALVLMRKKALRYDATEVRQTETDREEWWLMSARPGVPGGERESFEALNPRLDEAQTQQVSEQLSEILEAEL